MKIIIVGGGISGLATYLYLKKTLPNPPAPHAPHEIKIYEAHRPKATTATTTTTMTGGTQLTQTSTEVYESASSGASIVGAGLGVSPNGMRVLRDLDVSIHAAVRAQGFACENFVFMGANGWVLGMNRTGDKGGFEGEEGGKEEEEVCVSSSRYGLWACLRERVPEGDVVYRRVIGVEGAGVGGRKAVVRFEEGGDGGGEEEECDLVVGADGVKSVVRKGIYGADEGGGRYKPSYTGLSGIGGFIKRPLPENVLKHKAMVFTFGGNGFFGYASGSPADQNNLMWWSTWEVADPPTGANLDTSEIKKQMQERHAHWRDPVVREIVSEADVGSVYPTWVLDDLPTWGEKGLVLVGDAAHALSPTTGQGASQALEDSQTLALALAMRLQDVYAERGRASETADGEDKDETGAVAQAIKLYQDVRSPRVKEIAERGRKMDGSKVKAGMVKEYIMYLFLWILNRYPSLAKRLIGDINTRLYGWNAREELRKELDKQHKQPSPS